MWVARNKIGELWVFLRKPYKGDFEWITGYDTERLFQLPDNYYPEVKWSDEEPRELILK